MFCPVLLSPCCNIACYSMSWLLNTIPTLFEVFSFTKVDIRVDLSTHRLSTSTTVGLCTPGEWPLEFNCLAAFTEKSMGVTMDPDIPVFLPRPNNVTFHRGDTALLPCAIENVGTKTVGGPVSSPRLLPSSPPVCSSSLLLSPPLVSSCLLPSSPPLFSSCLLPSSPHVFSSRLLLSAPLVSSCLLLWSPPLVCCCLLPSSPPVFPLRFLLSSRLCRPPLSVGCPALSQITWHLASPVPTRRYLNVMVTFMYKKINKPQRWVKSCRFSSYTESQMFYCKTCVNIVAI